MGFDPAMSMINLFNRFNKTLSQNGEEEILDAEEVREANAAGIGSIFQLTENMTMSQFQDAYIDAFCEETYCDEDSEEAVAFEQKINAVHVKYLQNKYGSNEPIGDEESLGAYENRLKLAYAESKLTDKDRNIYENALKNQDNYEIVKSACNYFHDKVDNGEIDLRAVYGKVYELAETFTDEYVEFSDELPPDELNVLSKITGGFSEDDTPEQKKEILSKGSELVGKYSNHKCMQWVSARIEEWYEVINSNE